MRDSRHVTNFASDVVPIATAHTNTSFKALLDASHIFSDTPLLAKLISTNCYGITNLLLCNLDRFTNCVNLEPYYTSCYI